MERNKNRDTFAKNLNYYIDKSGRSKKEIADIVEVAPSTFNEWTKGKKYPRMDKVEKLAQYFGCKKSDLIEEKKATANDDLSKDMVDLINRIKNLPEDKVQLLLQLAKSIE